MIGGERTVVRPDRRQFTAAALFLLLALVLRAPQFGNPVIQIDEQFYLLVGDRMHHGALPYVDYWDRKPVGLFLVYYLIRLLGGDGILQYQLVATGFAAATALMIANLAARIAPRSGGWWAGALYLIFLMVNGGDGGQAPIFYNLFVACAAWAVVRTLEQPRFDRHAFGFACATMALVGITIQIKYSVVFEGFYFGVALIAIALHRRLPIRLLIPATLFWVALTMAPTGLAWAWFVAQGHGPEFVFANFQSIFLRGAPDGVPLGGRIAKILIHVLPMAVAAAAGIWWQLNAKQADGHETRWLIVGWVIASVVGVLAFGTFHDHYALPMLVPFAVAGAPIYAWVWAGRPSVPPVAVATALFGVVLTLLTIPGLRRDRGANADMSAMVAAIKPQRPDCLFVFSGDPVLYHLTNSCVPTRWNFPTFLSETREEPSLGVDAHLELQRVMTTRPAFIVTRDGFPFAEADPAAWKYVNAILARDYQLVLSQAVGSKHRLVYRRRVRPAGHG